MFRIAHISDTHMRRSLPGVAPSARRRCRVMDKVLPAVLARCVANGADMIVFTGDLVEMPVRHHELPFGYTPPSPNDYRQEAIADYRWIREQLEATGLPYIVLPGNHDCDASLAEVFADQEDDRKIGGYRFVRFTDREWRGNVARRFDPQRKLFNKVLNDSDPTPQIHLQHYLIHPQMNAGWPYAYGDAVQLLTAIVASRRVVLSLSGHFHRGFSPLAVGDTTFVTAPAMCEGSFPWLEITLEDGRFSKAETRHLGADFLPRRKVVFLDRDGVINPQPRYHEGTEAMELIDGSAEAIRKMNQSGRAVVVITNQNGVGMGIYPPDVVYAVNDRMCELLAAQGAFIDGIYCGFGAGELAVLPHYVDTSINKPSPAMLNAALSELNLDLEDAWFIGDNITDIQAGLAAGVQPALVRTGHGAKNEATCRATYSGVPVYDNLKAFADARQF